MPYICVDDIVIRLPSYLELLDLPPAKEMPVAVYKFNDLTAREKSAKYCIIFTTVTQI